MVRVLIVDDHAAVRQGVRQLLTEQLRPDAQGEASSADEAIEMVRRDEWDVVILDVNMPGKGGLEALRAMKQTNPNLPVVMFSVYPPEQVARRFIAAGASAYVSKESAAEELVNAVRKAVVERHREPSGSPRDPSDPWDGDDTVTAWHL